MLYKVQSIFVKLHIQYGIGASSGCGSKTLRIMEALAEHDSHLIGLLERSA